MKHLKLYESKILDDILDKISEEGETSLSNWEREYLSSYEDTHKREKMEKEKENENDKRKKENEKRYKSLGNYDPRKDDTDFYKKTGEKFGIGDDIDKFIRNMDDEEYEKNKLEILWDTIADEDLNEFFDMFSVQGDYATKTWDKLPNELKNSFNNFLILKGYIEK